MVLFLLVQLLLIKSTQSQQECFNVNTTTHQFVDSQGRERYFHGVNVVVKGPPWIPHIDTFDPQWSFSKKDMEILESLGMNAIRFGMMWPGAEPMKDQFNQTYFEIAKWIVKTAADYNIHVLLDMHQDVLSPKFCGEGAPDWAIETGNAAEFPFPWSTTYPVDPKTGYPTKEDCDSWSWSDYYTSEATSSAFQHIYDNTNGLLDQLAEYWWKVASEFKNYSSILGYEIINEPWAGDIYHKPTLALPKVADKENLQHVYDVVSSAIRKNDPCHNVFFESVTWDELTVGFERVPLGKGNEHRSVLSYHLYIPPQIDPDISFYFRKQDFQRLQCGGFLTEFGLNSHASKEIMRLADKYLQSWTGWDYKSYYDITGDDSSIWFENGTMNMQSASDLSRTYAQAVAGLTKFMTYDPNTHLFQVQYIVSSECISDITEIYLNEAHHYNKGFDVSINPNSSATWQSPHRNRILVTNNSHNSDGTTITVIITAKN